MVVLRVNGVRTLKRASETIDGSTAVAMWVVDDGKRQVPDARHLRARRRLGRPDEGIILWTRVTPTGRDRGEKDHSPDISFPVTWVVSTSAPKSKRMTTTTTTTKQGHGLLSIHMRTRYSLDFRL